MYPVGLDKMADPPGTLVYGASGKAAKAPHGEEHHVSAIETTARNADMQTILGILNNQRARRLDVVANSAAIHAVDGNLVVADAMVGMSLEGGVGRQDGTFQPTAICDEKLAARLDIPTAYLKKLRGSGRTDLWDANVNGLLHGGGDVIVTDDGPTLQHAADPRKHLLRLLAGDPGEMGVARAVMSQRYRFIETLDWALAVLAGINDSGATPLPPICDLSDRRFYMRIEMPEIAMLAPKLLDGYRNPFGGQQARERAGLGDNALRMQERHGQWTVAEALAAAQAEGMGYKPGEEPVVWAGIVASNSETGDGSASIAPQIRVKVCRNGLTIDAAADRKIHLGGALAEGQVEWSQETAEAELALVTAQVRDAVRTWCKPEWLAERVAEIEALASAPIANPQATIKEVAKATGFTQAQADAILAFFIDGGQATAGGLANAATAYAQTVASPEVANFTERHAVELMQRAATLARR